MRIGKEHYQTPFRREAEQEAYPGQPVDVEVRSADNRVLIRLFGVYDLVDADLIVQLLNQHDQLVKSVESLVKQRQTLMRAVMQVHEDIAASVRAKKPISVTRAYNLLSWTKNTIDEIDTCLQAEGVYDDQPDAKGGPAENG